MDGLELFLRIELMELILKLHRYRTEQEWLEDFKSWCSSRNFERNQRDPTRHFQDLTSGIWE
jgi:hypothetical protein